MLYNAMLCYAELFVILCYVTLRYVTLHYVMLCCHVMLFYFFLSQRSIEKKEKHKYRNAFLTDTFQLSGYTSTCQN